MNASTTEPVSNREAGFQPKQKLDRFLIAMAVLLLLVAIYHAVTGAYARYITTADATASARVAKFTIDIGKPVNLNLTFAGDLIPNKALNADNKNNTRATEFTMVYDGETAVEYVIDVNSTGNIPLVYQIYEKGSSAKTTVTANGNEAVFASHSAGKITKTYVFEIYARNLHDDVNGLDSHYANQVELIEVIITARQVD